MDTGRGFILIRGLRTEDYGDTVAGAIFYLMGLHLGSPMPQNQYGDVLDHVIATSNKTMEDPTALPSRVRDRLPFHSDSSDVVALMCLRGARHRRRIQPGQRHHDLQRDPAPPPRPRPAAVRSGTGTGQQDPDAPADTYRSPICSYVDGVLAAATPAPR